MKKLVWIALPILLLFGCYLWWLISTSSLFLQFSTSEEVQEFLLEQLPLGSTHIDQVQIYMAQHLSAWEYCLEPFTTEQIPLGIICDLRAERPPLLVARHFSAEFQFDATTEILESIEVTDFWIGP